MENTHMNEQQYANKKSAIRYSEARPVKNSFENKMQQILHIDNESEFKDFIGRQQMDNIEETKLKWRKEKNRIAAKKSREKKARQIADLEFRYETITKINGGLIGYINEYELILENILIFVNCVLKRSLDERQMITSEDGLLNNTMIQSLDRLRYFLRRLCIMVNTDQYMMRTSDTDASGQLRITQILNNTIRCLNEYFEIFKDIEH